MFIGIDLGTSSVKVVLLDERLRLLATVSEPLTVEQPQPLWSEQHPVAWWDAVDGAMLKLRQQSSPSKAAALSAVRAIGLSGQMHGAVVLDQSNRVLRPAILWNDGRAAAQCAELEAKEPKSRHITGNLAMPGFTAPKLLWLAQHEPHIFSATKTVLLPKDWLRLELTGEAVSEMSDASGTLWLDVAQRRWSEPMLAACGLSVANMPRLIEGSESSGMLLRKLAQRWGLGSAVIVAGGAGDNAASAIGIGAIDEGQGFLSLGTSGVIFLGANEFRPAPERAVHAFAHALPQRWHQMSVMLSAASAVSWAARTCGFKDEAELGAAALHLPLLKHDTAPLFLPYLSGERTPHNNANASGAWYGLRHEHSSADLGYAALEGVGFGLLDGLRAMQLTRASVGLPLTELTLVGGGARSDIWAQMLASILNVTLRRFEGSSDAAATGAARLAFLACGGSVADLGLPADGERVFEPNRAKHQRFDIRHQRFTELYRRVFSKTA